jgi:hypothetical protein
MLIEITGDAELKRLLGIDSGFLLDADYCSHLVTIHIINCRLCNPVTNAKLSPSKKKENKTGEIWFSDKRNEIMSKASNISEKRKCVTSLCEVCHP